MEDYIPQWQKDEVRSRKQEYLKPFPGTGF